MRGERGTLPGGTGWESQEGTCGRGGSCGGGRLTSALRSSTSMEESSSGSEWICTGGGVAAISAATSAAFLGLAKYKIVSEREKESVGML